MNRCSPAPGQAVANTRHGKLTLGIAGLAAMATYLDTTILFVAFPGITHHEQFW